MTEYANLRNSLPVRCPVLSGGDGHCEPDVEGLAWRMRWAHEHPVEAAEMGRRGGEDARQNFGVRTVAEAGAGAGGRGCTETAALGPFHLRRCANH